MDGSLYNKPFILSIVPLIEIARLFLGHYKFFSVMWPRSKQAEQKPKCGGFFVRAALVLVLVAVLLYGLPV